MANVSQNLLMQNKTEKAIESQFIKVVQDLEDNLDEQITRLDNMDEDELESIRQRRFKKMKEDSRQRAEWQAAGHGVYSELSTERDFFTACKTSTFGLVCHFYRDSTFRCKIIDKHLALLSPKHIECKMVKINAEKAPFLTKRLGIMVIPTIILVKNEQICDRIVGFDDLGGRDEFSTAMLEWRLAHGKVIKFNGDLSIPPDDARTGFKISCLEKNANKNIRGTNDFSEDYSD